MSEHTHRVVGEHRRTPESPGRAIVFEDGDPITPTDAELRAFGDKFEPLDDDGGTGAADGAESETSTETAEDTDDADDDADDGDTVDESDESETADENADGLTASDVEAADYNELRSMAGEFDEINGNWGEARLRAELLDAV